MAEDFQAALKDLPGETVKEITETDMDMHLDYEKSIWLMPATLDTAICNCYKESPGFRLDCRSRELFSF
jgi:hypothetical protein